MILQNLLLFFALLMITVYGWGVVLLLAYLMKQIPRIRRLSLRWRLVIGHTFLVLAVMAVSLITPRNSTEIIGGDYWPFFIYPGYLLYAFSSIGTSTLFEFLHRDMDRFPELVVDVYLPGAISILIGSVIWYGVGLKGEKWVKHWNEEEEDDQLPLAILIDNGDAGGE